MSNNRKNNNEFEFGQATFREQLKINNQNKF